MGGKRTYISTAITFALGGLHALGIITQEQLVTLTVMIGSLGVAFLRSAVNTSQQEVKLMITKKK